MTIPNPLHSLFISLSRILVDEKISSHQKFFKKFLLPILTESLRKRWKSGRSGASSVVVKPLYSQNPATFLAKSHYPTYTHDSLEIPKTTLKPSESASEAQKSTFKFRGFWKTFYHQYSTPTTCFNIIYECYDPHKDQ